MPDSSSSPDINIERRLTAILAADIAGYSALMGTDDAATVRDLKAHQAVVLPMITAHGGRVIDTAGDGILAEFASVLNAVGCAIAMQGAMAGRNQTVPAERRIEFRIGINQGDVISDGARVFGDGVNIAARLEGIAFPGGICISGKVHDEVGDKLDIACQDLGEQQLKNISRPVRVYHLWPNGQTDVSRATPATQPQIPQNKPTIAILPFTVIGGDADQDYLADGMVEELIAALSAFQWLSVIARNSCFAYKDRAADVGQIARELGVRYLLEGSIRKSGNRIRLTSHLIDANGGTNLWTARYDRELKDVFEVQDEITREIVSNLGPEIAASEWSRNRQQHPSSLTAWDAYIRALPLLREHSKPSNAAAESLLRQATTLAPDFSAAFARLSACRLQAAYYSWGAPGKESIAEAWVLAQKSKALNASEPLAYDALASVHQIRGELAQAIAAARTALQLSSTCTAAYGTLITALAMSGNAEEALAVFANSERTNPRDPDRSGRLMGLSCAYFILGRYEDAITAAKEYVALRPNWYGAYLVLAAALALTGRTVEAQAAAHRLLELIPHFTVTRARQRSLFAQPEHTSRVLDGLKQAGIPD